MKTHAMVLFTVALTVTGCVDKSDAEGDDDSTPTSDADGDGLDDDDSDGELDCTADADGDGLDDCEEDELGTDPEAEDSDNDGFTDADEVDCVSNPLDADEFCYACGWEHNDPGNLEATGDQEGDVMDNFSLVDQCGEMVDMWDFHGEYFVLYQTAAW